MSEAAKLRLDACAGRSDRLEAHACRGACHRFCRQPRQSSARVAVHEASAAVVFAVADGESGAAQACHAAVEHLLSLLPQDRPLDFDSVAYHVTEQLAQYVTTLVAGVVQPDVYGPYLQLFRIGDSGAWLLDRATGACHALFEPVPHVFESVEPSCRGGRGGRGGRGAPDRRRGAPGSGIADRPYDSLLRRSTLRLSVKGSRSFSA